MAWINQRCHQAYSSIESAWTGVDGSRSMRVDNGIETATMEEGKNHVVLYPRLNQHVSLRVIQRDDDRLTDKLLLQFPGL